MSIGTDTVLYFAYGSNMDAAQLAERCPSSRLRGAAVLPGFRRAFTRWSPRRRCGVLDIVPDAAARVRGALFELDAADLDALDRFEFVHAGGYRRIRVELLCAATGRREAAVSYEVIDRQPRPIPPSRDYLQRVLSGAAACGLPDDCLDALRQVACRPEGG